MLQCAPQSRLSSRIERNGEKRMEDFPMVDQKLQRTLTLWDGVALAVGSIAGSGILYLPSLTYVLAGHDVLLVWLAGVFARTIMQLNAASWLWGMSRLIYTSAQK